VLSSTETVSFFIYINKKKIIIIPLCTFKATPYEIWFGEKPDLSHLKVFGTQVFIHIPDEKRKKLDEKSIEGILVGYCDTSKAYRIWDPATRTVKISRDVRIDEHVILEKTQCDPNLTLKSPFSASCYQCVKWKSKNE
jgi:hypothetical protein